MLNRSASLAMSTCIPKALPGKHDFKRHSPSILFLHTCDTAPCHILARRKWNWKGLRKRKKWPNWLTVKPKTWYRPSDGPTYLFCWRAAKLPHFSSDVVPPKNYDGGPLSIEKKATCGPLLECWLGYNFGSVYVQMYHDLWPMTFGSFYFKQ